MAIYGKKVKLIRTLNLYLMFFGIGASIAIPGPTLLDLQRIVNTDSGHISFIYIARSAGYLLGSIIAGVLLDRFRKQLILLINFILVAISITTVPWWSSLLPLILNILINGFAMGAVDTGTNISCLDIWGKECGPYLQALHFCFGLGAFVAPLIAEPFLSVRENSNGENATESYFSPVSDSSETIRNTNSNSTDNSEFHIHYAYGILGIYCMLIAIIYLVSIIMWPKEEKTSESNSTSNIHQTIIPLFVTIISLITLFMCLYAGIEITFGQMLTTFAVKGNLKLSESIGSYMTSVYWGTYTFARGFSIFLVTCSNLLLPIIIDLLLMILAGVCLSIFGDTNVSLLWTGIATLGFGLSSVFPSVFAWLESHVPVNSKVASLVIVGISLGEMIVPLSVGHFIDRHPMSLMYTTLGLGIGCAIIFAVTWRLCNLYGKKGKDLEEKNRNDCHATEGIN